MRAKRVLSLVLTAVLMLGVLALSSCGAGSYNLPIVCGETGMNDAMGVATYGVDYYSLGVKAGDMAADILINGANPAEMAVATDPNPALSVNETVAQEIGFTIPDAVKNRATGGSSTKVTRDTSVIVTEGADYTVGILQLVQHVALDQANVGFQDQLSVRMAAAGKKVAVLDENASGDEANNATIVNTLIGKNVDLIYTIATSSSQAAAAATDEKNIPVVFNAVTDPVGAGLVASMAAPGKNVTGVSDINPVEKQIELITELLGSKDIKVGFLYTSAETNSVTQINMAKAYCEANGIEYVERGIADITELKTAMIALSNEKVDAIYVPTDNVLANGAATVHAVNIGE
ncbi:MAG: ABC transporter substrate-binding protein [Clostridia bacterium]|nr:ABC transporter substrate-binding protein [Clostridia bacterium]